MCRNCGYKLWPSSVMASAAFKAWQAADPEHRSYVSRFDMDYPPRFDNTVDYVARAQQLGIHLFPSSNWPFVICLGSLFLALAAIPFPSTTRIVLAVIGAVIFLWGVVGWVLVEDVKMFPDDSAPPHGSMSAVTHAHVGAALHAAGSALQPSAGCTPAKI